MKYNKEHCNIPGCNHRIYRNYMCKEHYAFYLIDDKCREISDDVIAVYEGKGSWKQKALAFRDNVIHHAFDYPMIRYEHFPLEHVFLLALRCFDKHDKVRCSRVIEDFDISANENIAMFKRIVNVQNVDDVKIKPVEFYLLSKQELISVVPFLISIFCVLLSYLLLRLAQPWTEEFFGMTYQETVCLYKQVLPYLLLLMLVLWSGIRLASFYNYFAQRAYNLSLFENVTGNINMLSQIKYVKDRNLKASSYKCSVLGGLIGISLLVVFNYFSNSSFHICSFAFVLSGVMMVASLLYVYNMTVLYFPVFEALKQQKLKIDLYNPDHNGGLAKIHNFLFKTFVYNEGLILIVLWLCFKFANGWVWFIVSLLFIMRVNHARWSAKLYISSLKAFYRAKKVEREKLLLQNDDKAFDNIEKLDKLYGVKVLKYVWNIALIVVLPYLINNADDIIKWIGTQIPIIWNAVLIR